jgi:hypothetical protein
MRLQTLVEQQPKPRDKGTNQDKAAFSPLVEFAPNHELLSEACGLAR